MTGPLATAAEVFICALGAAEAEARLGELSAVLLDAVAHGASVNFLAGFSDEEGREFWRGQLPGIAAGDKRLFIAENNGMRLRVRKCPLRRGRHVGSDPAASALLTSPFHSGLRAGK